MVPEDAASTLAERASAEHVDMEAVERYLEQRGLLSMAIIEGWRENLGDDGRFVHWGSTSQDVMDTTVVLQVREALDVLLERLRAIEGRLADHVEAHADTPMIGRTHHVHAVPTTFGLKAASWLEELGRQVDQLSRVRKDLSVCQFGGAIGTYATFGEDGPAIADAFAAELGLEAPTIGGHAARDRIVRLIAAVASVAGTLARVAKQVLLLGSRSRRTRRSRSGGRSREQHDATQAQSKASGDCRRPRPPAPRGSAVDVPADEHRGRAVGVDLVW